MEGRYCRECGKTHPVMSQCPICGRCKRACSKDPCGRRPAVLRNANNLFATGNAALVNTLGRPLGIEVELAEWGSLKNEGTPKKFRYTVAHDGSVTSGQELVTAPLAGDKFLSGMVELGTLLVKAGTAVDKSCGLHVHVGATDLSYWDIRRVIGIYSTLEEQIYQYLVAPARSTNRFCFKMRSADRLAAMERLAAAGTTTEVKAELYNFLYGTKDKRTLYAIRADKYGNRRYGGEVYETNARYLGLNIHSWLHRGTVEWRMHEGTIDTHDLVCWPLFCGWFIETATKLSDGAASKVGDLFAFIRAYMPAYISDWAMAKSRRVGGDTVVAEAA